MQKLEIAINKKLTSSETKFIRYIADEIQHQAEFYHKQAMQADYESDSVVLNLVNQRNIYLSMARYIETIVSKFEKYSSFSPPLEEIEPDVKGPAREGGNVTTGSSDKGVIDAEIIN